MNAPTTTTSQALAPVLEGIALSGKMNTDDATLRQHIASAIRRGHPQVKRQMPQPDHVCLVGGGPSLQTTLPELLALLQQGAKLVTVNGAYHWALAHHLLPQTQIVMDARPSNARFVDPPLPRCHYAIASTCHPDLWDRLEGRDRVWIWHPVQKEGDEGDLEAKRLLDEYYLGAWEWVSGGTTVITRALFLLRLLGYLRFDLFGVDSCWLGDDHHAYAQPENAGDRHYRVTLAPSDRPDLARTFRCSGWHLKQFEDWLRILKTNGEHFLINVHGNGLLAHAMRVNAQLADTVVAEED